jgi:HEAT repeat protein
MSEKVRSAIDIISTGTDGDPKVAKALESLKDVDVSVVIAETSRGLTSDDDNTRRAAIYILWRGNLERIDPAPLIQACKHKEDLTRGMAALALGENHAGAGEQTLIDMATKDPSHYARRCAAYALGLLGDPAVLPTLQKVKGDSDPAVAYNAKAAIKMLSGKVVTRPTTKHE